MSGMRYKQYEIVIVNLNPTVGTEIRKVRPCLILSPNEMNFDNVIVAHLHQPNKTILHALSFKVTLMRC